MRMAGPRRRCDIGHVAPNGVEVNAPSKPGPLGDREVEHRKRPVGTLAIKGDAV